MYSLSSPYRQVVFVLTLGSTSVIVYHCRICLREQALQCRLSEMFKKTFTPKSWSNDRLIIQCSSLLKPKLWTVCRALMIRRTNKTIKHLLNKSPRVQILWNIINKIFWPAIGFNTLHLTIIPRARLLNRVQILWSIINKIFWPAIGFNTLHLTINPLARVGYEMIDSQRGA